MKLYRVKGDRYYGNDAEEKRRLQIEKVQSLGLEEVDGKAEVICTAEQAIELLITGYHSDYGYNGLKESVTPVYDVKIAPTVEDLFATLADKLAAAQPASFNQRCQQHQPNEALLNIAETMLLENCCTDELQRHLGNGWRIIAVQPQPDQRRPDYILGRPAYSAQRG